MMMRLASVLVASGWVGAVALREHEWGTCTTYSASVCSQYLLPESKVFVYNGVTQAEMETTLALAFDLLDRAGGAAFDSTCKESYKAMACHMTFPSCLGGAYPQRICTDYCNNILDVVCKDSVERVNNAGFGNNLMTCNQLIGDTDKLSSFVYDDFLSQWKGTPLTVDSDENLTVPGLNSKLPVQCNSPGKSENCPRQKCPVPYIENARSVNGSQAGDLECQQGEFINCDNCMSQCSLPCHYPSWRTFENGKFVDDAIWDMLWVAKVFPGVFAIPLTLVIVIAEAKKMDLGNRMKHYQANTYIFAAGMFGLLYSCFESLPSLALKFDVRCDGSKVATSKSHDMCALFNFNIHLLQGLMASVVVMLYILFRRLTNALAMKKYKPSKVERVVHVSFVVLFPLICLIGSATTSLTAAEMEIDTGFTTNLKNAFNIRYAFSCAPAFSSIGNDWVFLTGPLLICGLMSGVLSIMLLQLVVKMNGKSGGSNGGKEANRQTVQLARTMLKFATVQVILNLLNLGTAVPYNAAASTMSASLQEWVGCAQIGGDRTTCNGDISQCKLDFDSFNNITTLEIACGKFDSASPNKVLLFFLTCSQSLPAFFFGLLFFQTSINSLRESKYAVAPN